MISPIKIINYHPRPVLVIQIGLFTPDTLTGNCSCIWIQQRFLFIKNKTLLGVIRSIHSICIFKIIDIQSENKHGINPSDPVMLRKRQDCIGFSFSSVIQKELHICCFHRTDCKADSLSECRSSINPIKTRSDIISLNLLQGQEMLMLCHPNPVFIHRPTFSF